MNEDVNIEHDRVRENTSSNINDQIDRDMRARVSWYATRSAGEIEKRIEELNEEWDIERVLQTNASVIGLTGLLLGVTVSRKWLAVPGIVLPFLFQHAVQGWCPPVPLFRRIGVRTRKEIDREKYALKALRGDFQQPNLRAKPENALDAAA